MYAVVQNIINRKDGWIFDYSHRNSELARALYNASLFRLRQNFTGWDKEVLSENETLVYQEIKLFRERFPKSKVQRILSQSQVEKMMRLTKNPDFFAGLPMQTAQYVVKQAVQNFWSWLKALKDYKKHPEKYLGKPKMPKYRESPCSFEISNQDAVVHGNLLKLPKTKDRLSIAHLPKESRLKSVRIIPYYGRFIVSLTFEKQPTAKEIGRNIAGIDFGVDNIAAIVTTDGASRIYKGGAILSENQFFAKEQAKAKSIITKGHRHMNAESKHLDNLSFRHATFVKDQLHKISRSIVSFCQEHDVGILVLGVNKFWKQYVRMRDSGNQKFVQMPIAKLRWMITYKAAEQGIVVIEHEESYTAKASFVDGDFIPVYKKAVAQKDNGQESEAKDTEMAEPEDSQASKKRYKFSGRRISRGLYKTKDGIIINADLNGAANIVRKAIPDAWYNRACMSLFSDYSFLSSPQVMGFHDLNPKKGIPVKGIRGS